MARERKTHLEDYSFGVGSVTAWSQTECGRTVPKSRAVPDENAFDCARCKRALTKKRRRKTTA